MLKNMEVCTRLKARIRAVDPDPHGSAFICPSGSGSAFKMQIRIQVEKIEEEKT